MVILDGIPGYSSLRYLQSIRKRGESMLTGTFCSAAALLVRVGMTLELEVSGLDNAKMRFQVAENCFVRAEPQPWTERIPTVVGARCGANPESASSHGD